MLKLSYYTIVSSPVDRNGTRVIYSTRSGSMLTISDYCFQALMHNDISLLPDSIREKLTAAMVLVSENEDEIDSVIQENREHTETKASRLYEIIQPTAMCQLGCYYCGQKHTKDYLSNDLIGKITERIANKFVQGDYKSIYIGWFGAEPLMALPQMRIIYSQLKTRIGDDSIPVSGKIVTNGLSLKPAIFEELITKFNIDHFEITIDGIGQYHDQHRYTKSGEASFDIIYGNLKAALESKVFAESNCTITIRCNVDYKNVEGVEPLIRKIAADNLQKKIDKLYFIGIYSWGGNDAHKNSLTKEKFAMMKLKWEILKLRLGYRQREKLYIRKKQTCIATGGTTEMYDAFGNIYNCTEIPYADIYKDSEYILGNLKDDHQKNLTNKPHNDWYDIVKNTDKYPCHSCKLLPVCGGSCPKSWTEGNPACPSFKFSILKELELEYLVRKVPDQQLPGVLEKFEMSLEEKDFFRYE